MRTYTLCDGPGPNPDCPQLTINDDGSAVIGEDKEGVGICRLNKKQFNSLKKIIQSQ
ncbi:MAG: hypothetical protein ABH950_06265 [Candidatus Altiarchaeota archaeon]